MKNTEIADIVECEGLGYTIMDYLNSDSIEDEDLKEKWIAAERLLQSIQNILDKAYETDGE